MISNSHTAILWRQVWGVATLLAVVLLSFTIYGIYQPKILKDLGFVELSTSLGIWQGFLGIVIEPLFGTWSDRILARLGSRLPLVTAGITLAGLIFVIAAFLLQSQLPPVFNALFPLLMTFWVMAMIAVRGPVAALLIQFAPIRELPIANAAIVLVLGLTAALGPLLGSLVQQIGASISFTSGAIALLIAGTVLYSTTPQQAHSHRNRVETSPAPLPAIQNRLVLILIFGVGLGATFEGQILLGIFPQILQLGLPALNPAAIASCILVVTALSANPWSRWVIQWGEAKAMQMGLGAVLGLMGLTLLHPNSAISALILTVVFGLTFGLIFTDTIPYALSMLPIDRAGLATGLYFGGGGAATAIFALLQQKTGGLTGTQGFCGALIAFLIANICLMKSSRLSSTHQPKLYL